MMKPRSIFFAFALAATVAAFAAAATPHGPTALAAAMPDLQSPATAKVTFRGTEYLLRSSHGNGYDFTPRARRTSLPLPTCWNSIYIPRPMTRRLWPRSPVGSRRLPRARKPPSCELPRFPLQGNNRASISWPQ